MEPASIRQEDLSKYSLHDFSAGYVDCIIVNLRLYES